MIIDSINDTNAIETFDKDIRAMSKAIASLKRHRAFAKKVKIAFAAGRIDEEKKDAFLSSIHENIRTELFIIQERGLGLGEGDDHGWDHSATTVAQHYINKATK